MQIKQMRQTIMPDPNLALFQQAINDQFANLAKIPFINGNLISNVGLTAGSANNINHGLERKPQGYFIFSNLNQSTIWNDAFSSTTVLTLRCSLATTVSIWVF